MMTMTKVFIQTAYSLCHKLHYHVPPHRHDKEKYFHITTAQPANAATEVLQEFFVITLFCQMCGLPDLRICHHLTFIFKNYKRCVQNYPQILQELEKFHQRLKLFSTPSIITDRNFLLKIRLNKQWIL
jgi:hypothetical protein